MPPSDAVPEVRANPDDNAHETPERRTCSGRNGIHYAAMFWSPGLNTVARCTVDAESPHHDRHPSPRWSYARPHPVTHQRIEYCPDGSRHRANASTATSPQRRVQTRNRPAAYSSRTPQTGDKSGCAEFIAEQTLRINNRLAGRLPPRSIALFTSSMAEPSTSGRLHQGSETQNSRLQTGLIRIASLAARNTPAYGAAPPPNQH